MVLNIRFNCSCQAIATLDEAKLNCQKQQEQITSLQSQLDKVDEELESLTSVYTLYRAKVQPVKILGQNERLITAEVIFDIRK